MRAKRSFHDVPGSRSQLPPRPTERILYARFAFDLFEKLLPLASFAGSPYSVDEPGIVKCVFKTRCAVGARMQIANKMSVDRSHIDRRTHKPTGDRGLLGCRERDV